MKGFPGVIFSMITALVIAGSATAKESIEITDITSNFIKTPDIAYKGDQRRSPNAQDWLELEVTFNYNPTGTDPNIIDELKVQYYVYIKPLDKVLTGEVTHMYVEKGRGKMSVMYLAPQVLKFLADGKRVSAGDVDPIGVQVFYKGQLVAKKSSRGAPDGDWWTTRQQIQGALLNKNNTPFSALYWDRYELIKPESR